MVCI